MTEASRPVSSPTVARVAAAALAFFLCGVVSAALFFDLVNPIDPMSLLALRATYLLPLPFGIALWLICYRYGHRSDEYALAAILATIPVWIIARLAAMIGLMLPGDLLLVLHMCLCGMTGALGVTLASAMCRKYLLHFRFLAGAAVAGSLAAIPFVSFYHRAGLVLEMICFGIWQAGVGTYLFWVCRTQDSASIGMSGTVEFANRELPHD